MDIGKCIHSAQVLIAEVSSEIDAMMSSLERLLARKAGDYLSFRPDDTWNRSHDVGLSDPWIYPGWDWRFDVSKVSRGRPKIGVLQICIDINLSGLAASVEGIPMVYVAWAPDQDSLWDFHPPLAEEQGIWDASNYELCCDGKFFWWLGPKGFNNDTEAALSRSWHSDERLPLASGNWFYLLPLVGLKDEKGLNENIIKPVRKFASFSGDRREAESAGLLTTIPLALSFGKENGKFKLKGN